jgi:hypothetical protein
MANLENKLKILESLRQMAFDRAWNNGVYVGATTTSKYATRRDYDWLESIDREIRKTKEELNG